MMNLLLCFSKGQYGENFRVLIPIDKIMSVEEYVNGGDEELCVVRTGNMNYTIRESFSDFLAKIRRLENNVKVG